MQHNDRFEVKVRGQQQALFNFKEGGNTIFKCSPLRGISVVYSYAGSIKGNLQCIHNVLETNGFPC
jgi:hypothetical protein